MCSAVLIAILVFCLFPGDPKERLSTQRLTMTDVLLKVFIVYLQITVFVLILNALCHASGIALDPISTIVKWRQNERRLAGIQNGNSSMKMFRVCLKYQERTKENARLPFWLPKINAWKSWLTLTTLAGCSE